MTTVSVQAGYTPLPVPLGQTPDCKLGRRAIHVLIDFSLGTEYQLDLSQVQSQGAIDSLQTLYIDNGKSAAALDILMGLTLQQITLPPGAQGYIPILQGNPPVLKFSVALGSPVVNVQLLNFFVPPAVWYTTGLPVDDLTLLGIINNGAANVNVFPSTVLAPLDASGTIAAAGVRQQLLPVNPARKRWILTNPSTALEVLQFSYVLNTAGLIDLVPGETWNESDMSVSGDEIWVVAATMGHAFIAYSW